MMPKFLAVPLQLLAAAATPAAAQPAEMTIGEGAGRLHGTFLPAATTAQDAEPVLILAGSGPTDRDGNNPLGVRAASYRLLAEGLAARGVASLRVDKRGIAASAGAMTSQEELRIQAYADDALAWAEALRTRTGARCVWLLGHSEGSLHALLAARRPQGLCGLILVSSVGRRLPDTMREQLRSNPANAPILDQALQVIAELEAGRNVPVEGLHPALAPLFNASVQPFLISMFQLDPAALAAAYPGPMLVVGGSTDLQTTLEDARRLAGARPGITLRVIEGMNHVLKAAPADRGANFATYANPDLPLADGLVDAVADFVRAN